jgi:hypothetical protein
MTKCGQKVTKRGRAVRPLSPRYFPLKSRCGTMDPGSAALRHQKLCILPRLAPRENYLAIPEPRPTKSY